MTSDPLTFAFAELEYETGDDLVRRFRAAHPGARYVVLDVHPDDVPDMLADWSAYPGSPWLTPAVESTVRAQPVAVLDTWPQDPPTLSAQASEALCWLRGLSRHGPTELVRQHARALLEELAPLARSERKATR